MTLHVHTARMGYKGPDWLDISLKGNTDRHRKGEVGGHRGMGMWFAPSAELLYPYIAKRKRGETTPADWEAYVAEYTGQMRASYRLVTEDWHKLLALPRVVLLCFCPKTQCHRRTLAGILVKLGAVDDGEISA